MIGPDQHTGARAPQGPGLTHALDDQSAAIAELNRATHGVRDLLEPLLQPLEDKDKLEVGGHYSERAPLVQMVESHTETIRRVTALLVDATSRLAL